MADDAIGATLLKKTTKLENELITVRQECAVLTHEYVVVRSSERRGQQLLSVLVLPVSDKQKRQKKQKKQNTTINTNTNINQKTKDQAATSATSATSATTSSAQKRKAKQQIQEWQQAVFESIVADQRTREGRLLHNFFSIHLATQMKQYQIFGKDCLPPPTTLLAFCNYFYQIISVGYRTVLVDQSSSSSGGKRSLLDNPKIERRLKIFISRIVFRRKILCTCCCCHLFVICYVLCSDGN